MEKTGTAVFHGDRPLRLLDLPLDVLKLILKEIPHTNDLTSLALTNSTLHSVVTPLIYSKFDIVWPDELSRTEPRMGVDALTYGLATLVMREDIFQTCMSDTNHSGHNRCYPYNCKECGKINYVTRPSVQTGTLRGRLRGNHYSQFVKKFSLGNGPHDWVQEYLITKESGKMLGTLVALSIARMPNLETFIWDMPTGIVRDIWVALSSLGDHQPSKLRKLWVRFHNNKNASQDAGVAPRNPDGHDSHGHAPGHLSQQQSSIVSTSLSGVVWSNHTVEEPNFSAISAIRSLNVLAIDEVAYLHELSVLIKRSLSTLRELRIGMASQLCTSGWPRGDSRLSHVQRGGPIALLMSKVCDTSVPQPCLRQDDVCMKHGTANAPAETHSQSADPIPSSPLSNMTSRLDNASIDPALMRDGEGSHDVELSEPFESSMGAPGDGASCLGGNSNDVDNQKSFMPPEPEHHEANDGSGSLDNLNELGKLNIEVLEFEKMTINVPVLQKGVDWSFVTSLTLLQCGDTEALWKALRKTYAPLATVRKSTILSIPTQSIDKRGSQPRLRRMPSSDIAPTAPIEYRLKLKRLHTDTVSSALISFLKETLAPNSLEWMFLQDSGDFASPVTVDSIYKGPLKRHRASLTKLLIDSSIGPENSRPRNVASKKWILNRDILTFITSGKMQKLRELSFVTEYKDWHLFLQRIPRITELRSLHVPFIADHPYERSLNVKELAMGIVDVLMLRQEIPLCYLAISNKCYEIVETKAKRKRSSNDPDLLTNAADDSSEDDEDHIDGQDNDADDDEDDEEEPSTAPDASPAADELDDEADESLSSADEEEGSQAPIRLKLREILFYDDKISIFKARHARL